MSEERLDRIAKRDIKRAHTAEVEQLGKRLLAVPLEDLKEFRIDPEVLESVMTMHQMKPDSAWRRLERFLYKIMRKLDEAELDQVAEAVAVYEAGRAQSSVTLHEAERWRDRLISEGDPGVEAFLEEFEGDRQQLRQLTRQAQREKKSGKAPKSARALFKVLFKILKD